MQKSHFVKLLNIIFSFFIAYALLFILCQCLTPDLGKISITVTANKENSDLQKITISTNKTYDNFYFLLYEDNPESNWIYSSYNLYSKPKPYFLSEYLPTANTHYIYFEGSNTKNVFNVDLKPKYSIGYMSSKEHVFHLAYIVPYKLLFFPNFYYTKHLTFFVDPIIS